MLKSCMIMSATTLHQAVCVFEIMNKASMWG